jgi:hypothetical protein
MSEEMLRRMQALEREIERLKVIEIPAAGATWTWGVPLDGTVGHAMCWDYDGVDGTARTIIAHGTGDVLYLLDGFSAVRASDGNVAFKYSISGGVGTLAPGGSAALYSAGGGANVLTLAVAADGSVTVQRTAGALTYKVALFLLWL